MLLKLLKQLINENSTSPEEESADPFLGAPEEPAPTPEEPSGDINTETAKKLIFDTKGKFFTVTFIKKDGSERVMNARLNVKKYLKGGVLKYDAAAMGYIPVYDMQSKGYRMVNSNTIKALKIGKKQYNIPTAISEATRINPITPKEHEIKNIDYYQQILNKSNGISPQTASYFQNVIASVKKRNGKATDKQWRILQRIKTGEFNLSTKN